MTIACIFLDESGDLGWSLDKPRGNGGSSRFIVLAAIVLPFGQNKHLERLVTPLYKKRGRSFGSELKSTALNGYERRCFASELAKLARKHPSFSFHAVVAEKSNVPLALSRKTEVLYNHMAERMLHDIIADFTDVEFYPDARMVKERDKNALHNYIETRLAIAGHSVNIRTIPSESGSFKEIQATDILASIIWSKYEANHALFDNELGDVVKVLKLY
jgi:Protein of unknown function (DUF3800)